MSTNRGVGHLKIYQTPKGVLLQPFKLAVTLFIVILMTSKVRK